MSRLKIKRNLLLVLIISIILTLLSFNNIYNFNMITIFAIIELAICGWSIFLCTRSALTVGFIFLCFTFLFNFGQSVITTFFKVDKYAHRNVLSQVRYENYIYAEIFVIICIAFYTLGYLLECNKRYIKSIKTYKTQKRHNENKKQINTIMWLLLMITIIPMVYIDALKIISYLSVGYDATYLVYQHGIGKYLNLIGQFCKPIICILIYTNCDKKIRVKLIVLCSIIYCGIMMISGDRGSNIIYIITILFVYYHYVEKLTLKTLIFGILGCYFMLMIISIIGLTRSNNSFSIDTIMTAYEWRKEDGVLYATLREFGATLLTLCHSMAYIPEYSPYNFGLTYLLSWLTILPKYPSFFDELFHTSFTFTAAFPTNAQSYEILGGNYLGELYFNFGWLGCIGAFIIGKIIAKIDIVLIKNKSVYLVCICISLLPSLILWVRDFFVVMLFRTVWITICILFIAMLNQTKSKKDKGFYKK